ncbi:Nitrogenase [Desulfofarcimen acetoxidans DSM 771]|uniref:Nitrogenase n=1 Tax=Desulfofarcimen acetoxidans (strain ATCC 49208 / DSM 771 / KCTC 5769 / VKM B-1644 / 5575) TaxID=485916 RepID=C8W447_DESAS|nr:Nitrogenase [Desulfofarcimen acetoxidans DSM 771]
MKKENLHYKNVNENPCNMCMPMGGILPFKGLENSMVIIHGSQGCSTYMRRHMAEHFNEPIDVGSTSLNEKGTIYGGGNNLKRGLDNILKVYQPGLIGVLTTCLAETIGEDTERLSAEYLLERGMPDYPVIPVPTPGYGGSHAEGYWLAVRKIVGKLARETEPHNKINIIIPNISPADIREIKRLLQLMQADYTLLPDFSDTLDRPYERSYKKMPEGGTKVSDIIRMAGAMATVQLGLTVDENYSPGLYLEREFGVPFYNLPIPMGVESVDLFLKVLSDLTGNDVPECLLQERGRLLDCMIDSHKYNFQGKSVIFGEPELVYAISRTCLENGIKPVVVATGSKTGRLSELLKPLLDEASEKNFILEETDFVTVRSKSKEAGANIAIGHSDGKYLTERESIPLVRMGFPIHDRVGGQRLLSVGYTGTTMFLDRVTNKLLENKHGNYRKLIYQNFYRGTGRKKLCCPGS